MIKSRSRTWALGLQGILARSSRLNYSLPLSLKIFCLVSSFCWDLGLYLDRSLDLGLTSISVIPLCCYLAGGNLDVAAPLHHSPGLARVQPRGVTWVSGHSGDPEYQEGSQGPHGVMLWSLLGLYQCLWHVQYNYNDQCAQNNPRVKGELAQTHLWGVKIWNPRFKNQFIIIKITIFNFWFEFNHMSCQFSNL